MTSEELQAKGLKAIILSQLLIEANDDLKNTTMYKGNLKKFGKMYMNQLGHNLKQVAAVNDADPQLANNVYNNIDALAERLAKLDVKGIVMVNQIHEHYSKHPEDWENTFMLEITELKD